MPKLIALLAALLVVATSAAAQDIRWKPETLRKGDYTTIDQSMDGLIHHVFRGKAGRYYLMESYRGAQPSGSPEFSTYLDKDGNQVRWVHESGFEIRYKPHDCTRTLGRCQYTQRDSNGAQETRLRITKATRNGIKFDEYGADGKRLFGGQVALDNRGNAGNGKITGTQGVQNLKLMRKSY